MATALEMFDALRRAVRHVPPGAEFIISRFDALDLCRLTAQDLGYRSVDRDKAEKIAAELERTGDASILGPLVGVRLSTERNVPGLIPGEGIRQAAGMLKDDPQTLEEMLEEMRMIRHGPEGRP